MGLKELFIASSVPILEVLIVTAVGAFLAIDRINLLGQSARKSMNNIVFYVFNPPLVATNLAKTITVKSLAHLWFMPINILLTFIIGSALGWIVFKLLKAPSRLKGLILGTCSADRRQSFSVFRHNRIRPIILFPDEVIFHCMQISSMLGNLGNILLIIVPAICDESGSPFGEATACKNYGMGYASLSMAIGAICIWTYVYNIVRVSSNAVTEEEDLSAYKQIAGSSEEASNLLLEDNKGRRVSVEDPSTTAVHLEDQCKTFSTRPEELVETVKATRLKNILKAISDKVDFKKVFAPSTIGVIVGFTVGLVSPIRKAFIGDGAPLRVIEDSAVLLSNAAIPSITLILGGNLIRGIQGSGIRYVIVIAIVAVRYVLLPVIGIGVVKAAVHFGLVGNDPLYQFILLMQFALPPAMNIGTITQLFGAGENECSVIFLWTYALASVALTLWCTFFMWLVSGAWR